MCLLINSTSIKLCNINVLEIFKYLHHKLNYIFNITHMSHLMFNAVYK